MEDAITNMEAEERITVRKKYKADMKFEDIANLAAESFAPNSVKSRSDKTKKFKAAWGRLTQAMSDHTEAVLMAGKDEVVDKDLKKRYEQVDLGAKRASFEAILMENLLYETDNTRLGKALGGAQAKLEALQLKETDITKQVLAECKQQMKDLESNNRKGKPATTGGIGVLTASNMENHERKHKQGGMLDRVVGAGLGDRANDTGSDVVMGSGAGDDDDDGASKDKDDEEDDEADDEEEDEEA